MSIVSVAIRSSGRSGSACWRCQSSTASSASEASTPHGMAGAQPASQFRVRRGAVEQQGRRAAFVGERAERGPALALEEGRIADHRQSARERVAYAIGESRVGAFAGVRGVQSRAGGRTRLAERREAREPLAFEVGAQMHRGQLAGELPREPGLARSRQAMHQQQPRPRRSDGVACDADVVGMPFEPAGASRRVRGGGRADRHDLGAHQRAMRDVEIEYAQQFEVPAAVEVSRQEGGCEVGAPVAPQVGAQERDLVGDVDPAERRLELQRVERRDPPVEAHQVRQVQVAMALAHPAGRRPRGDE